jgi:hypothetical protein
LQRRQPGHRRVGQVATALQVAGQLVGDKVVGEADEAIHQAEGPDIAGAEKQEPGDGSVKRRSGPLRSAGVPPR